MVFDDSFEHEVVHGGEEDRLVLYAVLHHPDLGTPKLREPEMKADGETCNEDTAHPSDAT